MRSFQIVTALLLLGANAFGQYSVDWFKIAGGGGTSTGGVYCVSGTIGQHDAGTLTGGNYSVEGGFWNSVSLVQTPGAPLLSVHYFSPGAVSVSWPVNPGWILEQKPGLETNAGSWSPIGAAVYQTNNGSVSMTAGMVPGNKFYRLRKVQ